jgi:hypothetical protein
LRFRIWLNLEGAPEDALNDKIKKFFCFGANVISFTACRKIYSRLFFVIALTFVDLTLRPLIF